MISELCQYEKTGPFNNGEWPYRCCHCGHTRTSKYPPEMLRRACVAAQRTAIEEDIATDPRCTRPMAEIQAFLDVCLGGCRYMKRHCTRWGSLSEHDQLWVEHVIDGDCDQFTP